MPSLRGVLRKIKRKHGTPPSSRQDDDQRPHSASFLSLPAELRNQIYHELAAQIALTLTPHRSKKPPILNGLLLACHQTRAEFMKVLFANAHVTINIHEYKFSNLIRVLETLPEEHLSMLKLNRDLWIIFYLAHVPSRDDRRNLRGWVDYRGSRFCVPYFGSAQAQQAARELFFEYDVRYLDRLRPPRPPIRYLTRHDMKLDLLRSHLRLYKHLEKEDKEEARSEELVRLRRNVEECVHLLEDLQLERSTPRNMSVVTTCTLPGG